MYLLGADIILKEYNTVSVQRLWNSSSLECIQLAVLDTAKPAVARWQRVKCKQDSYIDV